MAIASNDELIMQRDAADILGINRSVLSVALPLIDDFPKTRRVGKQRRYLRSEIIAWAKGKDVKRITQEAWNRRRRPNGHIINSSFDLEAARAKTLALSKRLFAGEFATAEQRDAFALRRLTAKTCKPKTVRICITPDWMTDLEAS